jgi:hypothetical protein
LLVPCLAENGAVIIYGYRERVCGFIAYKVPAIVGGIPENRTKIGK